MTDFEHARKTMVDNQLRTSNITDRRLLGVMLEVPRERFVPAERQALAYTDVSHGLGFGRMLSGPVPFARLVQLAEIEHTDKVLDIGTGTGYSAAVLGELAAAVVAVERAPELVAKARENLSGHGNVSLVEAPLEAGAPQQGPYDVIVLEGAVDAVPPALFDQLKDGGRLVAYVERGLTAVASVFARSGHDVAAREEFDANLPPLAPAKPAEEFVF